MDIGALNPLISEEKIQSRVKEIGSKLTEKFAGKDPVVIGVLNGSFMFYADLIRAMDCELISDFCGVTSYGMSTKTSGEVRMTLDAQTDLRNRPIVLVEDIVDSGLTMKFLKEHFQSRGVTEISAVTLLYKPGALKVECELDHVGFEIGNDFVVGYGLDYQGFYRSLPYIAQIQNLN